MRVHAGSPHLSALLGVLGGILLTLGVEGVVSIVERVAVLEATVQKILVFLMQNAR